MVEPRHLVLPDGIVSSGWPAVRDTCAGVGILFDLWQEELNRAMLAKNSAGLYAADVVAMSICRQSGKTYDVGGVTFADSIINPGTLTVWTAHRFKVARESFDELRAFAELPGMAAHVDPDAITTGAGNEVIPFRNGSKIMFASRERGSVRGFRKVRRLVLDEAQILTESAMADLAPTTNQAFNPQVVLMGTPPKPSDPSESFTSMRDDAIAGKSEELLYLEYGAGPDCDIDSWDAVTEANPSYPRRTGKRAVRRLRKLLSDDDYAREGLGIWEASGVGTVIDADVWAGLADPKSKTHGRVVFTVDVTPDHSRSSICVAGTRRDGLLHVELVENRAGTKWTVGRLAELSRRHDCQVALDPTAAAGSLLTSLLDAKVEPYLVSGREMAQACGHFFDQVVNEGAVRHIGQPQLASAVDAGRKRNLSEAWAWQRRDTGSDISPLVGVTMALHLLGKPSDRRVKTGKAAFV